MSIKTGYTDAIELEYLKGNSHTQAFFAPNELRKIENFQDAYNDGFQDWHIHHRLEINPDGSCGKPMEQLLKENLYYHRPASELIFLTESQHLKMHGRARHSPFGGHTYLDDTAADRFRMCHLATIYRTKEKNGSFIAYRAIIFYL